MNTENSNTIRVILRSRPTQNFATKNISLDSMDNVKFKYFLNLFMLSIKFLIKK